MTRQPKRASLSDRTGHAEKIRQAIMDAKDAGCEVLFVRTDETQIDLTVYANPDSSFGVVAYSETEEN